MPQFVRTFDDEFIRETIQSAIEIADKLECPEALLSQAFAATLNMVGQLTVDNGAIAVPTVRTPGRML